MHGKRRLPRERRARAPAGCKALGLSQKALAGLMHITQPAVSKLERQTDMQISTLASIVEAMGGTLEITARFPDREPVRLA